MKPLLKGIAITLMVAATLPAQFGGGFGGFGPNGRKTDIVEMFDKDGKGYLNAAERKEAREYAKTIPRRGMGRRFSSSSSGLIKAGPHLTPAEVKKYSTEPLYDMKTLRTIFIEFEDADWEREMEDFYRTDVDIPAKVTVDGKLYPDAGVHFRGNTSYSWVATGRKRSLDLSMNMVHSDQRLYGYRSLNFLNANQDPSFMRSVMYHALTMQYTAAPKTNFVRVVINGESWGIYANQEQFNSDMTKEFFGDNKGARWKTPGRPGSRTGLRYMGDSVETYKALYEIKTKDKAESWNDLIHLCKVLNQTPPEQLEAALNNILDIDGALKFLAMDKAMINNDGYWVRASDYSLYEDSTGKFHVFGNDANETLQNPEYMGGWGSEKADLDPFAGAEDPEKALLYRLLKVPSLRERYLRHLKEIANTQLDWARMAPIFQQAHDLIAADVHADTRKLYTNQDFDKSLTTDLTDYGGGMQDPTSMSIKTFMDQRRQYLVGFPDIKNLK